MLRITLCLFVVVVALLPVLPTQARTAEDYVEILTNRDFETGDLGAWHAAGSPPYTCTVSPVAAQKGNYGARLFVGPHGSCVLETDHYLIRRGGTYSAQVAFNLVALGGTSWLTTQVNYYNASHSFLTSAGIGNTYWSSPAEVWTVAHSDDVVPIEATYASLLIDLQESIGAGSAETYIDDASLFGPSPTVSFFIPLLVRP